MKDTCKQTSQHRRAPRVELICTGRDQPKLRIRIFQHTPGSEPEQQELFEAKQTFIFSVLMLTFKLTWGRPLSEDT